MCIIYIICIRGNRAYAIKMYYKICTRCMGYQRIVIELLCSSIIAKSEEYAVSGIVRQLNIDNFTAACNGGSIRKHYVRAKIAR